MGLTHKGTSLPPASKHVLDMLTARQSIGSQTLALSAIHNTCLLLTASPAGDATPGQAPDAGREDRAPGSQPSEGGALSAGNTPCQDRRSACDPAPPLSQLDLEALAGWQWSPDYVGLDLSGPACSCGWRHSPAGRCQYCGV
jgi:hypothetical protein